MRYDKVVGCIDIHIDTKRIDANLRRAQDMLDQKVLNDMMEYRPFQPVSYTHLRANETLIHLV